MRLFQKHFIYMFNILYTTTLTKVHICGGAKCIEFSISAPMLLKSVIANLLVEKGEDKREGRKHGKQKRRRK